MIIGSAQAHFLAVKPCAPAVRQTMAKKFNSPLNDAI